MLNRDFANTTANVGLGALQKANVVGNNRDLGQAIANGLGSWNDFSKKQAYVDALKGGEQDKINSTWADYDPDGYAKYMQNKEANQTDFDNRLSLLDKQNQYAIGLENLRNANARGLAQFKSNLAGSDGGKYEFERLARFVNSPEFEEIPPEMQQAYSNRISALAKGADFTYNTAYQQSAGKKAGEYSGDVDVDKAKGYSFENGVKTPVAGTESEREYLEENGKKIAGNNETQRISKTVLDDINALKRLIAEKPGSASGFAGSVLSYIPGTTARDIKARIDSIKGNSGVDSLLRIKAAGAGLGQIPQSQMDMLSSMQGNLSQSQTLSELFDVINRYEEIYKDIYDKSIKETDDIYGKIKKPQGLGAFVQPQNNQEDPLGLR